MTEESKFARFVKDHQSGLIVCALVGQMVISPVADRRPHVGAVLAGLIWILILLAARYMASRRLVKWVVLPLAGVWLLARLLEAFAGPGHIYSQVAPIAGFALSCALLWGIFERAHHVPRSPGAAVAEAFIAYLVITIAFAQLYWILNQMVDGAFTQPISPHEISTLLYFSLVTISTVGYGVIAPHNPYVRMVAAFEGVTGIFYVAVVVARLVALYAELDRKSSER